MRHTSFNRISVNFQPSLRLVDLLEERVSYTKSWHLPFNMIALCLAADPQNPSWVELPEKKLRCDLKKDMISFTTCNTPVTLHFAPANCHCCIHFNYELLPGVDVFSGIRDRYMFYDPELAGKIKAVFADTDPMRRIARAEMVAMELSIRFWPKRMPLDLRSMMKFEGVLSYVREHLNSHPGIPEMAKLMGWSDAHFSRIFREVFHITPKQYLRRELFAQALAMLKDPDKSIKEIAAELGFSSGFNFSRFVKQCSNLSPSEMRQGNRLPLYVRK